MKRSLAALVGAVVLATSLTGAAADGPIDTIAGGATVSAQATWSHAPIDVVNIYNRSSELTNDVAARAISAAEAVHAAWAFGRGSSVGVAAVRRNDAPVQVAPTGFMYPMSVSALPATAVGPIMGKDIAGIIGRGYIIMGKTTADLRGAAIGDTVDFVSAGGSVARLTIGLVAQDSDIGGTEVLMSTEIASALGVALNTRILLWGFDSRDAIEQSLANVGLTQRLDVRVRRSWDAFDPDSQISMSVTKAQLGEFAFRVNANGADVTVTGDWEAAHMATSRELLSAAIPIRARCNLAVRGDLMAALDEVAQAGLGAQIDVVNANTYGGCYYPRFNRISGDLGFLSRHSWGQALDTNTVQNAQGTTPKMNCDVVRIFRKHNFAWGGNFLTPDGMHFEWVGTRRDQYQYPSRFCPNLPAVAGTQSGPGSAAVRPPVGFATMLADDGFDGE